eukprot:7201399-Pyramimonas_sp.AAC.3
MRWNTPPKSGGGSASWPSLALLYLKFNLEEYEIMTLNLLFKRLAHAHDCDCDGDSDCDCDVDCDS